MAPLILHSQPFGERIPPNKRHSIIPSLPTWESVGGFGRGEDWVLLKVKSGYPRFCLNENVKQLNRTVLTRLNLSGSDGMTSAVFVSAQSATRCAADLNKVTSSCTGFSIVHFFQAGEASAETQWAQFYAVIYPADLFDVVFSYWRDSGDGISTRHTNFCLRRFNYLQSKSTNQAFCTLPTNPIAMLNEHTMGLSTSGIIERDFIKSNIARLVQSEKHGQRRVSLEDIFLHPGGMAAINSVARALVGLGIDSGIVGFGYLYGETATVLKRHWSDFKLYSHATSEELDELEASLKSGTCVNALWTDLPGNPTLVTPDMHRLRRLADEYDFLIICDETVGTFINTDLLPYVDVLMTSLTKIYSGFSDVLAGSVVVHPGSSRYIQIRDQLAISHEEKLFPLNIAVLRRNSRHFSERVKVTNHNAKAVAERLAAHSLVERINYPSLTTPDIYERYRRRGGGYGHLMCVIFKEPANAVRFYNALDVCKGPSFGTAFTLSIPFSQLLTLAEQAALDAHGIPSHSIRISVGMEDLDIILRKISDALEKVEKFAGWSV